MRGRLFRAILCIIPLFLTGCSQPPDDQASNKAEDRFMIAKPTDEDIRMEAYLRIYNHQAFAQYNPNRWMPACGDVWDWERAAMIGISNDPPAGFHPMSIIVKNGNITLEGRVDSQFDKDVAGVMANQVGNVFSATNNLVVPEAGK